MKFEAGEQHQMVYGMVLADEVPSTLHNANLGPFQNQN